MKPFVAMLLGRLYLAAVILYAYMQGDSGLVTINGIVWVVTLFIPYLGRKDERYYFLDGFTMATFATLPLVVPFFLETMSTPFGIDKPFHILGGVCVAWFVVIAFEERFKSNLPLAIMLITLVVGIGWEVFEYILGVLPEPFHHEYSFLADSIMDLVADLLGATIVSLRQAFK